MQDTYYSNVSLMITFRQQLNATEYSGLTVLKGKKKSTMLFHSERRRKLNGRLHFKSQILIISLSALLSLKVTISLGIFRFLIIRVFLTVINTKCDIFNFLQLYSGQESCLPLLKSKWKPTLQRVHHRRNTASCMQVNQDCLLLNPSSGKGKKSEKL